MYLVAPSKYLPKLAASLCCGLIHGGLLMTAWADTVQTQLGDYQFTIPSGMQLERITTEELTTWPILADWDLQGRLLVVESGGVAKPIVEHNKQLLHRVIRLEDTDRDGVFDKRTVVAKDLPFMEGILCVGRDVLVTAPPNIYRLGDADGDGIYESQEVWFDGQTITGCANDLHGPYLGRDGWVYWCKGAFAEQRHELLNGQQLVTKASHIFRRKLSGGAIEPVMTGGMDNPVEMAITPEGERFFTSTFLHHPGNGLRDGIAHAVYGGVYGKDQPAIEGHVRTGDLMPVMVNLGGAAPSGLICLNSGGLLPAKHNGDTPRLHRTLVAALFNLQKVTSHSLTTSGASFASENRDLVVANRVDFHPTDVIEDADGSLLIIDTGGWYDLCCPSSRVDQKTAAGGIYRLSKLASSDTQTAPLTSGPPVDLQQSASRAKVIQWLNDARPWVVRQAQLQLLTLDGAAATDVIDRLSAGMRDDKLTVDQQLQCLWGLCSLGSPAAVEHIARLLTSHTADAPVDASLLQAGCHALALHRFSGATGLLTHLLRHPAAHVRRTAAEALGRCGEATAAQALLAALSQPATADRHWQHSVTYALIELQADEVACQWLAQAVGTTTATAEQRQVAMLVIDQLQAADKLTPAMLLDGLSSDHAGYRGVASQILARQPDWAADYRDTIAELFSSASRDSQSRQADALLTILKGWRQTATVEGLFEQWLSAAHAQPPATQELLLRLISIYADSRPPAGSHAGLAGWLERASDAHKIALSGWLARMDLSQAAPVRKQLLSQAQAVAESTQCLTFLAALPPGTSCDSLQLEQVLLHGLRPQAEEAATTNGSIAEAGQALALQALARVKLSSSAGRELLSRVNLYPPRLLPTVIEAIGRVGDDSLDSELLAVLPNLPAARTLPETLLPNLYRSRAAALQNQAAQVMTELTRPPSDIEQKVDQVLAQLTTGDPIKGLQLFRSNKTACSGCHRLGYVGGEIGPNLTKIGASRTRRALLEAILFPSARLEQSYQPTKILTHDGEVFNGLITKHHSPTQFEMQLTADKSVILRTDDVAHQEPSQLSIMPSGLADLLTPEELSDLMAILEAAK